MDNMWANVLNEHSDDEDSKGGDKNKEPPLVDLDLTIDKSLSYVDEETVDELGCMLDGIFLTFSPDEEDELVVKKKKKKKKLPKVVKKFRDPGLPPRPPGSKKSTHPKANIRVEKRQDTKEESDGGFLSYMFCTSAENETREESQPPSDDASIKGEEGMTPAPLVRRISFRRPSDDASVKHEEGMAPAPLVRRISFRRVSSSFRRKERSGEGEEEEDDEDFFSIGGSPIQDEQRNESPKEDEEGATGFMSYIFGPTEESQNVISKEDTKVETKTTKEKKDDQDDDDDNHSVFSFLLGADNDSPNTTAKSTKMKSNDIVDAGSVRLVKRASFRREGAGRNSDSQRNLHTKEF